MNDNHKNLTYKVRCRGCGKITDMYFGSTRTTSYTDFKKWIKEHSSFPIEKQCFCDNRSRLLHDLISYNLIEAP